MALTLNGGGGNDLIFGGAGADTLLGGDGNDTVTWSIGGGNDIIDGQAGFDTLALRGGAGDDTFQVFDSGSGKLGVTASDGSVLDVSGMEQVKIAAGAGKDSIVIGDLGGTDIDNVAIDLGAGSKGESVTVQAGAAEVMVIESKDSHAVITNQNTFQTITIDNADASDVLNITSAFGNVPGEVIQAGSLAMSLHFTGGAGADTIFSGSGNDFIDGNQGNDVALMGAGNDIFNWDPGDGSDAVDGQAGFDALRFNGSNAGENIDILADGTHAELTRNVAGIDMHLNSVEQIELRALGAADNIHVHDMSGTVVKEVSIDLGSFNGTGDLAVDTVTVDGTGGNDHVTIASANGAVTITGLPAQVTVSHGELDDGIVVNGNGGNDTIDATGLQSGNSHLTLDGGAGNDTLTGGHDGDLIFGGDGHDILKGGDGADTIDGGAGDDDITGGSGDDVMGGGDGADTFHYNGALDGHDLIEGFATGQDHLDLTKFFDSLGVDPADRADRVSITDRGDGSFDIAVDADGNKGNGAEHAVAVVFATGPLTVGQDVVVHH
jgi:Ca2+-binding RTX toxin-like protein